MFKLIRAATTLARLGVVLIVIVQAWMLLRPGPLPLDSVRRVFAVLAGAHESSQPIHVTAEVTHDRERLPEAASVASNAWPARLAGWLAMVLLLPLALAPWLRRALDCRSNAVNLGLLLGLALAGAGAAYGMMGLDLEGGWAALLLVAAAVVALAYNWVVLDKMEEIM
jgi:hypothetical protein